MAVSTIMKKLPIATDRAAWHTGGTTVKAANAASIVNGGFKIPVSAENDLTSNLLLP